MKSLNRPANDDPADPAGRAAWWVEFLTSGEAGEADFARLKDWLAADPAHRAAYDSARAAYAMLPAAGLKSSRQRRLAWGGTIAASIALGFLFLAPGADHVGETGRIVQFDLPDGSHVWLDSDGAIDLAFDARRREVLIKRGRAAFKVAPDDTRPFSVVADGATITDVGTTFSVATGDDLVVDVSEGIVDVAQDGKTVRLAAGEGMRFARGATAPLAGSDRFAWRHGRILFNETRLADALAEIDRYRRGRIVLLDDEVADRSVTGTLFAERIDSGLDDLARSQKLELTELPWLTLVSRAD